MFVGSILRIIELNHFVSSIAEGHIQFDPPHLHRANRAQRYSEHLRVRSNDRGQYTPDEVITENNITSILLHSCQKNNINIKF